MSAPRALTQRAEATEARRPARARRSPGLREHVRLLIQSVVGVLPDEALTERKSSAGAYLALHVSCLLTSEEQRREVYLKLRADPQVVFTL